MILKQHRKLSLFLITFVLVSLSFTSFVHADETTSHFDNTQDKPPTTPRELETVQNKSSGVTMTVSTESNSSRLRIENVVQATSVQVMVWTLEDQSDACTYEAVNDAPGTYYLDLSKYSHQEKGCFISAIIKHNGENENEQLPTYYFTFENPCIQQNSTSEGTNANETMGHPPITENKMSGLLPITVSDLIPSTFDARKTFNLEAIPEHRPNTIQILNKNDIDGSFDVIISNISEDVKSVHVPVWSEKDGQDDIRWYNAIQQPDNRYKVTVRTSNHKFDSGIYHIHLYYTLKNNQLKGIGGTTTNITSPKEPEEGFIGNISIQNHTHKDGTFEVLVDKTYNKTGLREVLLPIWSEQNGQDDIRWYQAVRQENGDYKLSVNTKDHQFNEGKYQVHMYYRDSNGELINTGTTTVNVQLPVRSGKLTVSPLDENGEFEALVSDISNPKGVKSVLVPTWSEQNGQDDIRWYQALKQENGNYKLKISLKDHNYQIGKYYLHFYYLNNKDELDHIGGTWINLKGTSADINVQNKQPNGNFDVVISGVSSATGVRSISVPIWSEQNGQDDIRWYQATRQNNGSYKVNVQIKYHNYDDGKYNIHLYYIDHRNQFVGVGGISTNVTMTICTGNISIQNKNDQTGAFDIVVSNISNPQGLNAVRLPVWSEKDGQDDIRWYYANKQEDGNYKLSVSLKDHNYQSGKYHIHLYYSDKTSNLNRVGGTDINIGSMNRTGNITIANVQEQSGSFDVIISNILDPEGVKKVTIPVWAEVNGQNDIKWYEGRQQSDGSHKITVSIRNHGYETGKYNVHLYYTNNNNQFVGVGGTSININNQPDDIIYTDLTYNGATLRSETVRSIVTKARQHNILPSYALTVLHYEGLWGTSNVGRADNNWGGMTFYGNSDSIHRPSGVIVTRGQARPYNEGGHYMHYKNVDDFLTDWFYLLRKGGIYNVSGARTFADAIKGMFRVGGAVYDYAATGYNNYLIRATSRLRSIERVNGSLSRFD